jgi:hypothetical protein
MSYLDKLLKGVENCLNQDVQDLRINKINPEYHKIKLILIQTT